jgi:DNA-binding MarR family transcriptional regulator
MSSRLPHTSARDAPENLAILLREPLRAMNEQLLERLAERGHGTVRAPHGNVMQYLDDAGTRVSVLAERAQMTKQAMAELVAHLEAHDYVVRVPDPHDGRAKLVRATPRGLAVYAVARELVAEIEARVGERLGERELRELRRLLEALGGALEPH